MRALDSLILDEAGFGKAQSDDASVIIVCSDSTGDLLAAALETGKRVVFLDPDFTNCHNALRAGAEIAGNQRLDHFLRQLIAGSTESAVAIGEMPKSLARLDYLARSIAGAGFSAVRLVLGGNNKHLSRSMNTTLSDSFATVAASRGRGKFRCLVASDPQTVTYSPTEANGLVAFGGVFAGAKPDFGGELLRSALPAVLGKYLDLGSGNGSVSRLLSGEISATDSDADAVLSSRAIGLDCTWDDAGSQLPGASFDTIALNPPFHDGTTLDATIVQHLLDAAVRLLAPGGSLYLVHNSHLRYKGEVQRRFTAVEQVARNDKFTVLHAANPIQPLQS